MAAMSRLAAAALSLAWAVAGVDNTQPYGENLITGFSTTFIGNQVSDNSCTHRDLGFAGHIQKRWFAVYGDNIYCAPGITDPSKDTADASHGFIRDSVAALGINPLIVDDLNLNNDSPVKHPLQFVPWIQAWGETASTGFGGTSIVESDYNAGVGALYYLINNNEDYAHAGVAKVQFADNTVKVTQRMGATGWWWDTNKSAKYGDIGAYRDERNDYIWIWGHPPQGISGGDAQYVYQARVHAGDAFDLSKYEYWWGREAGWNSTLLDTFNTETAVMWGVGQGSMFYSNFYHCYVFVHLGLGGGAVYMRTAPSPEGPWSADIQVYQDQPLAEGALIYAAVVYPYFDTSNKSVYVAFTNNNVIRVIQVDFS